MRIAFAGKMGAGKTTAARILEHELGYEVYSLATPLKQVVSTLWPSAHPQERRLLLQRVGDALRAVDEGVFVRAVIRRLEGRPHAHAVVDDVRRLNELQALQQAGFVVMRIHCPDSLRRLRLAERDGYVPSSLEERHPSETELDDYDFSYVVPNTGTVGDLKDLLLQALQPILRRS